MTLTHRLGPRAMLVVIEFRSTYSDALFALANDTAPQFDATLLEKHLVLRQRFKDAAATLAAFSLYEPLADVLPDHADWAAGDAGQVEVFREYVRGQLFPNTEHVVNAAQRLFEKLIATYPLHDGTTAPGKGDGSRLFQWRSGAAHVVGLFLDMGSRSSLVMVWAGNAAGVTSEIQRLRTLPVDDPEWASISPVYAALIRP